MMTTNTQHRCKRCNKPLKNPYEEYGWRCAEILQLKKTDNKILSKITNLIKDEIEQLSDFLSRYEVDWSSTDWGVVGEALWELLLAKGWDTVKNKGKSKSGGRLGVVEEIHEWFEPRGLSSREMGLNATIKLFSAFRFKVDSKTPEEVDADFVQGDPVFYQEGGKDVWVDLETIEGIGFLSDGTLICGKNTSRIQLELAKLVMFQKQSQNPEYYTPYINGLALLLAEEQEIGDSYIKDFIEKVSNINYYMIDDFTTDLDGAINQISYKNSESSIKSIPVRLKMFYHLVKAGSDGDLKKQEPFNKKSLFIYDGEIVSRDAAGNILFGYLGEAFGLSEEMLSAGAGFAQYVAGTANPAWINNWLDDPRDTRRVRQGIERYKKLKTREKIEYILSAFIIK